MTTSNTRGYWIRTIRGWGEDRLSDPQYAELDTVLTWYEDSAGERDELKDENAKLREDLERLRLDHECTQGLCEGYARLSAQLKEANRGKNERIEEALDMLVNVYDLCNLNEEWAGKVAMVLAKNGIVPNDNTR